MGAVNPEIFNIVGELSSGAGYTELQPTPEWDRTRGWYTVRHFEGTKDGIISLINLYSVYNSGVDGIKPTFNGMFGTLDVSIVDQNLGNDDTLAKWECTENALVKPIETLLDFSTCDTGEMQFAREMYERAISIAHLASLNATEAASIPPPYNDDYDSDSMTVDAGPPLSITFNNFSATCNLLDYFLMLWKGETEVFASGHNLTKTTTVSLRSEIAALYTGLNRVVPGGITTIKPPAGLLGDLLNLPLTGGGTGQWEWVKRCPEVLSQSSPRGSFGIRYHWWGAEKWSKRAYGGTAIP